MARETQGSPAGEKRLERYGVWVKVGPKDVGDATERESSLGLSDLETSKPADGESALTMEEEKLLDELESELGPEEGEASIPDEEPLLDEGDELPDISSATTSEPDTAPEKFSDADLPALEEAEAVPQGEAAEVEVTLSDSLPEEEHFDDLKALEDELVSVTSERAEPKDESSTILARIEEELRSIRSDLTGLREELAALRKSGAEPAPETPHAEAEAPAGFFDEDEDETIALTGDELDNILNTAEVTEEPAETVSAALEPEASEAEPATAALAETEDILSYETPVLEAELPAPAEPAPEAGELDDLLSELPEELVLEELSGEETADQDAGLAAGNETLEGIPELDLETLPELEVETGDEIPAADDAALGEITVEEELPEAASAEEPIAELEEVTEEETLTEVEAAAEENPAVDVDLAALAVQAEELAGDSSPPEMEDLEIGELEEVLEEDETGAAPQKEIEIAFESEPAAAARLAPEPLEMEVEEIAAEEPPSEQRPSRVNVSAIPEDLKDEIRTVLKYMDHLLEALPDEKIKEFASSDYFVMYKKLFEDLGLGE